MSRKVYLFSTSSHSDAISINSLDINFFKPDIDFLDYDYFIITSKQASKALEQYDIKVLKPALCISQATAKSYESIGGNVLALGSGYGDDLALKIKQYPKSTKWLYLRAKTVASDFASFSREDGYCISELILYESECSQSIKSIKIEANSTLIFTSPSSVHCFLKNHTMDNSFNIIVIGKTTAKALPINISYKVSEKTTIKSCLDLVK